MNEHPIRKIVKRLHRSEDWKEIRKLGHPATHRSVKKQADCGDEKRMDDRELRRRGMHIEGELE